MKRIVTLIVSLALLATAVLPSAASAASSTCQSYNAQLCQVASNTNSRTASTLPFTGLDVGLLVAGGGVLLGAGLVVRRFSRGVQ
jgi:multisubunit Na+/H+ antiporter MnhB subunit